MLVYTSFESRAQQLFDLTSRVADALGAAGIPYQLVGGTAVYIHVEQVDPDAARLTRDVDVAIRRQDLDRIAKAVEPHGFELCHVAGVDLLVDRRDEGNKRRVHFVFAGERVHPAYLEPVTAEIEATLPSPLAERLDQVRRSR